MIKRVMAALCSISAILILSPPASTATGPKYSEAVDKALSYRDVQLEIVAAKQKWGDQFGMAIYFLTDEKTGNLGLMVFAGPADGDPQKTADAACAIAFDAAGNIRQVSCGHPPNKSSKAIHQRKITTL